MSTPAARPSVVIVGGGISGLAAAFFLRGSGASVTVLEGGTRLGGKLAVSQIAGIPVDEGAEALLARRPEAAGLIAAAGLSGQLVSPGSAAAGIWTRGRLRPLPRRQLLGVPADLDELESTGILSAGGIARAREDLSLPATARAGDVPVASYVGARFGPELVQRLVDPLLGGIYAGRSEELSFEATLGGLAQASRQHRSLAMAAAALLPSPPARQPPGAARPAVFTTLAAGLGTLPAAVAAASGADVATGAMARELTRTAAGWRLTVGPARAPWQLDADAVILAVPATPAGRLLSGVADPAAAAGAAALAEFSYASMAIITLAYPREAFGQLPQRSGYLVPAADGRLVKAVTFSTVKWPHLAQASQQAGSEPLEIVRCSVGRAGEEALLQRDDDELAALAAADLAAATGVTGQPAATRVSRWGGGLPQYTVGHASRVARIRAGAARLPGIAICGAYCDGVGVPACVGAAQQAAAQVLAYLRSGATAARGGQP